MCQEFSGIFKNSEIQKRVKSRDPGKKEEQVSSDVINTSSQERRFFLACPGVVGADLEAPSFQ